MTTYDVFVVLDSTLEQAERIYDHVDDATVASITGTVTVDFGRDAETLVLCGMCAKRAVSQ